MAVYIIGALVAAGILLLLVRKVGGTYFKYRGKRLVTCPETQRAAGVDVDARRAALGSIIGKQDIRLSECSRWPERKDCGQDCLKQIEGSPESCLVRNILAGWYRGKSCAKCGLKFGEINWMEHRPCLLTPEGSTAEWSSLRAENLPETLASHKPVCWNCHIAETFRRQHPDLVIDNPWKTIERHS